MSEESGSYRVGVVVFVNVPDAVDYRDAGRGAEIAIRRVLAGPRLGPLPLLENPIDGLPGLQVVEVQEVGMAAGNGYLWTEPTGKAFRRLEAGDGSD